MYVMIEIVEASKNREKEIPIYFHILKMTIMNPVNNSPSFSSCAHSLRYAATKHTATRRSD